MLPERGFWFTRRREVYPADDPGRDMNALKRVFQDGEGADGVSSAEVETLVVMCGRFATIVMEGVYEMGQGGG